MLLNNYSYIHNFYTYPDGNIINNNGDVNSISRLKIDNTGVTLTDISTKPATTTSGSLVIQHTTSEGSSNIIFPSVQNFNNDFAFLEYNEDTGGGEKGRLRIGI